ncbi:MAG: pyridoxamine kinase [Lachnospiraceae bacterium]|nr:pyridoxamine kinase [Lachnospiraceae bacterium]
MSEINHNRQKKIAVINDYSGFGRCSLAVELPIISKMKIQCCPLPTSIFSNHTGFKSFYFTDFTEHMSAYAAEWKKLDLEFNGICTGFLGSAEQIMIVENFLKDFGKKETIVVVDPVMGDYGHLYPTYDPEICGRMKNLIKYADIITPNLTEACILVGCEYNEKYKNAEIEEIAVKLSKMGPKKIVITGIPRGHFISNYCFEEGKESYMIKTAKVGTQRSGTGDIFTSIVVADAVNDVDFHESIKKASHFVKKCILKGIEMDIPLTDGVPYEELLDRLK